MAGEQETKGQETKVPETKAPEVKAAVIPQAFDPAEIGKMVDAAVQKHVAPLRSEIEMDRHASRLGLNQEQAKLVAEIQTTYPGMAIEKAAAFARLEKPEMFNTSHYNPAMHGSLPPGGDSNARLNGISPSDDAQRAKYQAAADKATEAMDTRGAQRLAVVELARRIAPYSPTLIRR